MPLYYKTHMEMLRAEQELAGKRLERELLAERARAGDVERRHLELHFQERELQLRSAERRWERERAFKLPASAWRRGSLETGLLGATALGPRHWELDLEVQAAADLARARALGLWSHRARSLSPDRSLSPRLAPVSPGAAYERAMLETELRSPSSRLGYSRHWFSNRSAFFGAGLAPPAHAVSTEPANFRCSLGASCPVCGPKGESADSAVTGASASAEVQGEEGTVEPTKLGEIRAQDLAQFCQGCASQQPGEDEASDRTAKPESEAEHSNGEDGSSDRTTKLEDSCDGTDPPKSDADEAELCFGEALAELAEASKGPHPDVIEYLS